MGASGRMGKEIIHAVLADPEQKYKISSALSRTSSFGEAPDLWIDFSSPEATALLMTEALRTKTPVLIGTTGLGAELELSIKKASKYIPILVAANTSIGVNTLVSLVANTVKSLGAVDHDIHIHESHHRLKKDAPSGTALLLARSMEAQGADNISISSSRATNIPGEHIVRFSLEDELIEIKHIAFNRSIFAKGALRAALWLRQQKPGLYNMQDLEL
jgi:4-hydroxy-tetrahydrodipicolinate reductase